MVKLDFPRYINALNTNPPGNPEVWKALVNQTDHFAYDTSLNDKGGPFGASLWLYNTQTDDYVCVGTADTFQDSNAVLSKGRASAHAEAENLSADKKESVINFLTKTNDKNWVLVQVSSGESCPSCRSKQVLFANELIEKGLIKEQDGFFVIFKATYGQTFTDAGFNDAPYDQTLRAINKLGILKEPSKGLTSLDDAVTNDPALNTERTSGNLILTPVQNLNTPETPAIVKDLFDCYGSTPFAVITEPNGNLITQSADTRSITQSIDEPEKTAIVSALYKAAAHNKAQNKDQPWNLQGAKLYTNITDIGPLAYTESLWYNLSEINLLPDYSSEVINEQAQELSGTTNTDLFLQVTAEYNVTGSPLTVIFNGNEEQASIAHLLWRAKTAREALERQQSTLMKSIGTEKITYIDGSSDVLKNIINHNERDSHYNGKTADPTPE
ncbi:MAG: hypothetical protein CL570_07905 [Alphaproteobacteria bacterium]|nr:hypothetical protein [Alphaproteobacteria bacterium]HCQ71374.1 hypothetical protein [Rhodospirillaceae bacterium]|tara:strand:- start:3000 stop:4322 length:1323 start_codon:yes stop_codon:yes gene_type:complete